MHRKRAKAQFKNYLNFFFFNLETNYIINNTNVHIYKLHVNKLTHT